MKFELVIDLDSKQVILDALNLELKLAEDAIVAGDYSKEAMMRYERALRIHRGILYTRPKPTEND